MSTSREAYKIDTSNLGSDLAGETAAAMAAASIVFKASSYAYSCLLLSHAKQDELLWAAMWLHQATGDDYYLKYVVNNAQYLGGTSWSLTEFNWDVKYAGIQVLASKVLMQCRGGEYIDTLEEYQTKAEYFLCACLQKNNDAQVHRTPGGLMYVQVWNNLQYVTTASFLLTVYSDYLSSTRQQLQCSGSYGVDPSELLLMAQSQVDYILGNNPRATSYVVGYGGNYPQYVHHRAASIVSIKVDSDYVSCRGGYAVWFLRRQSDPNVLVGALVGGPDHNDNFADQRDNYEQTEATTYNIAPLVGVLARLAGDSSGQYLPETSAPYAPTSHMAYVPPAPTLSVQPPTFGRYEPPSPAPFLQPHTEGNYVPPGPSLQPPYGRYLPPTPAPSMQHHTHGRHVHHMRPQSMQPPTQQGGYAPSAPSTPSMHAPHAASPSTSTPAPFVHPPFEKNFCYNQAKLFQAFQYFMVIILLHMTRYTV